MIFLADETTFLGSVNVGDGNVLPPGPPAMDYDHPQFMGYLLVINIAMENHRKMMI